MHLLSDIEIKKLARDGCINPFIDTTISSATMSDTIHSDAMSDTTSSDTTSSDTTHSAAADTVSSSHTNSGAPRSNNPQSSPSNNPSNNPRLSYGLSSSSYEVRIQSKFKLFQRSMDVVDPLDFDHASYMDIEADELIIPPGGFVLCVTLERFNIPHDISILCVGKSTYARCGIIVNPTLIEPGMEGEIVLELSNTAPCPVKIRAGNNGVAKFLFFRMNPCEKLYAGNYQNQRGIVLPPKNGEQ